MKDPLRHFRMVLPEKGLLYCNVKVIPKAQRTEFGKSLRSADGQLILKVKLAAAPERGKANAALCDFFREQLKPHNVEVSVVRGQTSQRKVLKVLMA